jgi:hypothetical protein
LKLVCVHKRFTHSLLVPPPVTHLGITHELIMSDLSAQLPEPTLHENAMPDLEIELALGVHKALLEFQMVFYGGVFHPRA